MRRVIDHLGLVTALIFIASFAFVGSLFIFNRERLNKTFKEEPVTWKHGDMIYQNGDIKVYQFNYRGTECLLADKYQQSPAIYCVGTTSKPVVINPVQK